MKTRVWLAAIVTMAGGALAAQSAPNPDSIPRELVQALLRPTMGASGGGPQFFVGKIPTEIAPFFYVPKGARVIGGMTSSSGTTVVVSIPGTYDQIRTMYQTEMPRLGWTTPPAYPTMQRGGFVSPPSTMSITGDGLQFCHMGQTISVIPVSDGLGGMQVTGLVTNSGGRCNVNAQQLMVGRAPNIIDLPTLVNPPGVAQSNPACFAQMQQQIQLGFNGTSERVQTTMTPTQLIDHFSKGLTDSGWKSEGSTAMARAVWTKPDTGKLLRELSMTITPQIGTPCQELQVQLRQYLGR